MFDAIREVSFSFAFSLGILNECEKESRRRRKKNSTTAQTYNLNILYKMHCAEETEKANNQQNHTQMGGEGRGLGKELESRKSTAEHKINEMKWKDCNIGKLKWINNKKRNGQIFEGKKSKRNYSCIVVHSPCRQFKWVYVVLFFIRWFLFSKVQTLKSSLQTFFLFFFSISVLFAYTIITFNILYNWMNETMKKERRERRTEQQQQ